VQLVLQPGFSQRRPHPEPEPDEGAEGLAREPRPSPRSTFTQRPKGELNGAMTLRRMTLILTTMCVVELSFTFLPDFMQFRIFTVPSVIMVNVIMPSVLAPI